MGARRTLGVRRRIRYLLNRVVALDARNLWRVAGKISRKSRRPRLLIVIDMMWCSVRYETGFTDYLDWDFYLLKRRERVTYMTHPKSNHLAQKLNRREFRHLFSDKAIFNERFSQYLGREWIDVREATADELGEFITRHGKVMVKITDSIGGIGIQKREARSIGDYSELRAELIENRQFLVEEFITQHERMAALCPTSVNTLRLISYFDGVKVHVLASVLKMGNGGDVDNFSNGGMYTMLDEHGTARYAAFDGESATYERHPLTGVDIVGFTVPLYDRALELVDELARIVPGIPYVGWDIAIAPERPIVIEGNYNTGVFQLKPTVSGVRTGLLPLYKEVIGF